MQGRYDVSKQTMSQPQKQEATTVSSLTRSWTGKNCIPSTRQLQWTMGSLPVSSDLLLMLKDLDNLRCHGEDTRRRSSSVGYPISSVG